MTDRELLNVAIAARDGAHCPYSGFAVGAALLTASGRVYTGINIENASYGVSNCAERTALYSAVAAGERTFTAIAVAGGRVGEAPVASCPPCGICRQALVEFCSPNMRVVFGNGIEMTATTLGELMPAAFHLGGDHT